MAQAGRLALARLAERAALEDPAVDSLDAGRSGLRVTRQGGDRVGGVVCAELGEGGYSVDLYVVALPEDLQAMADRVRATVFESARAEGVERDVASVSVHVEDLVEPGQTERVT